MGFDGIRRPGDSRPEPIAIVGVGCRLPRGISTLDELFEVFRDGTNCVTTIPPDRWDVDELYDPDPLVQGRTYVRHGGFVPDLDRFDAGFFGISDSEAAHMDPQQRMILEAAWHAVEDAGQAPEEVAGTNTGVFLSMSNSNDYAVLKRLSVGLEGVTAHDVTGDAISIAAGRVSHFLDLEGPCLTVDTACSGSLVCLHLARQSILSGDCDAAIVIGVNAIVLPTVHVAYGKVGMASRVGQCRAFDEDADGFVRSDGCVAVLLRRQSDAQARGDRILASVVATAVNQDGRTPTITAPNGASQERLVRTALQRAGVEPAAVAYVEAHGTGTPIGDPVEMQNLARVYGPGRQPGELLLVGSAKTNFGHLEPASGLVGLVKVALSLDRQTIFPNLHFRRLNSKIDLGGMPVEVPTAVVPWPRGDQPRLAGINSFGYSGTNAHAIVQEAPEPVAVPVPDGGPSGDGPGDDVPELLVLSAKSAAALNDLADSWTTFLDGTPAALADIAFTAATGRGRMRHRLAVVGDDHADVAGAIRSWLAGRVPNGFTSGQVRPGRTPDVAFVFTGQGAQHAGMSRQLYGAEPVFRSSVDRCAEAMGPLLRVPLLEILFGDSVDPDDTELAQPALFAVELALADLLRHWGVEPAALLGHSIGEIVAACVSGILDLEAAAQLAVTRGQLMAGLPRDGKMLAVATTLQKARELLVGHESDASLAAVNGPTSVVLSGRADAIDEIAGSARRLGRRATELRVSHAFHSMLMAPILDELAQLGRSIPMGAGRIPVISNLTGAVLEEPFDGRYWASHARQTVLFYEGLCEAERRGCSVFVEVGPNPALLPAVAPELGPKTTCLTTLRRDGNDVRHLREALGALFVAGAPVAFDRVFEHRGRRRVSLPLYPFRRDRHWVVDRPSGWHEPRPYASTPVAVAEPGPELHPLVGVAVRRDKGGVSFRTTIATKAPWTDHRVLETTVFPGTGYLELAARGYAAARGVDWRPLALRDVRFERPLVLTYGQSRTMELTVDTGSPQAGPPAGNGSGSGQGSTGFVLTRTGDGVDEPLCRGTIVDVGEAMSDRVDIAGELARMSAKSAVGAFYGQLRAVGLEYGSSFATVRDLSVGAEGSGQAIGRVAAAVSEDAPGLHAFVTTTVLDGCLQVGGAALQALDPEGLRGAFIPASLGALTLHREVPFSVWALARVRKTADGRGALADIDLVDEDGAAVGRIEALEYRRKASFAPTGADLAPSENGESATRSRDEVIADLRSLPGDERLGYVVGWLTEEIRATLGRTAEDFDLDEIDASTALLEIGLDSLLVTELQRRIQEKLLFRFKAQENLDYQSIESLGRYILDEVLVVDLTMQAGSGVDAVPVGVA